MPQDPPAPAPTREELVKVARLVLERKKVRDYRTNKQVAEAIGLQESEISRLLNARIDRHWGFARLSKVSAWLGVPIDEMLGRPEGTTKLMLAGGPQPPPGPRHAGQPRDRQPGRPHADRQRHLP